MEKYFKAVLLFSVVLFGLTEDVFSLNMTEMPENLQTKNTKPQERTISLKLPLLQPDFHWTFMSKEDFLSGKLLLRIIRNEKTKDIVIFEKGKFSDGWKEMDETQIEGRGEIYFGFISTTKYLTAPDDKLELELTVKKDLPGIGAILSGILKKGVYKSTGTYSGLIDEYDTSALEEQLTKNDEISDEQREMLDKLRSMYNNKAFLENWQQQWSLEITSKKGWLTDEQLLKLDQAGSRLTNSTSDRRTRFSGIVRDDKGEPLPDAIIIIRPPFGRATQTDKDGKFEFFAIIDSVSLGDDSTPYLIVRHRELNLAKVVKLGENTEGIEIQLSPGAVITGKVVDVNDVGLPQARIHFTFMESDIGYSENEPVVISPNGNFQINAIPIGYRFSFGANAEGYGSESVQPNTNEMIDNITESNTIVLKIANLSVSGIVVDKNDIPVAGARINSYGSGQQPRFAETDLNGEFVLEGLCEGKITIFATKDEKVIESGSIQAQAGATNVKIILSETVFRPARVKSLIGKPLPDMENILTDFSPELAKRQTILICFWDYQQRPSRNCVLQLAKQAQMLQEKNIVVVTIHTSKVDREILNEWIEENDISFPVGMIEGDEEKIRSTWGIKSLPWLILTDKQHVVIAEGFGIAKLDEKLSNN